MNKHLLISLLLTANCLLLTAFSFTQTSGIIWQNTIGGTNDDKLWRINPALDGGIFCVGFSKSILSGDKTETTIGAGFMDYWVMKLDTSGNIVWQNTIGGTKDDYALDGHATSDGGYILAGHSNSVISGDKTEAPMGGLGNSDYWIVKLNSAGLIEWQNTIGGIQFDYAEIIRETSDNGFIVGGYSYSGISGDKTEDINGTPGLTSDIWILKLDATGNILWQNNIGGNGEEQFADVIPTADGGYLVAAESYSGIGGDKSEANIGVFDNWLIKLDASGNIIWENTIGGNAQDYIANVVQTTDGNYVVGGHSMSGISGDKTEHSTLQGDYWIYKIDDTGNILWQNTIGGSNADFLHSVVATPENEVIIAGESNSGNSGDRNEANMGGGFTDYWLLRISETGTYCWQEIIGGNSNDIARGMYESSPGHYVIGGYSYSGISGDKTEINIGGGTSYPDFWVMEVESDFMVSTEVCNNIDDDCNGYTDDGIVESISISAGGPLTFCKGGSVLLSAVYTGESVQWKKDGANIPGATSANYNATKKATYTCATITNCDTVISDGIYVDVKPNPIASISPGGPTTFCAGGSVVLTANAGGGLSYQWYKGGTLLAGETLINYTATYPGNYKCLVTKTATGCYRLSNVISVSVPCKESDQLPLQGAGGLTIYPNPATNKLTVTINPLLTPFSSLLITDMLGKTISTFEITSSTKEIDISNYATGVYIIKLNVNGLDYMDKFVKQ